MTPAEHVARAEQLLAMAEGPTLDGNHDISQAMTAAALAHAVTALAIELGVPQIQTTQKGA